MNLGRFPHSAALRAELGRRGLLGASLAVGAIGLLPTTPAPAAAGAAGTHTIPLPTPTGRYPIGTTIRHLVDRSRRDPWVDSIPYRELMVSLWYPARLCGHPFARYMTPRAADHFDMGLSQQIPGYRIGVVDWAGTPTHARLDAPVAAGRHPVVLYGPGGGNPRTLGTGLVEELASHGYLVVAIDHTYEASEVEFPDGRLATDRRPPGTTRGQSAAVRVADIRFILDALGLDRVGMLGYSAGGFAAAEAMLTDQRIRAGVNLDGKLLDNDDPILLSRVAQTGLDRPFLQLATPGHTRESDPSWAAFHTHQRGWFRELRLAQSTHLSLSDLEIAIPYLATLIGLPRAAVTLAIGGLDPYRCVAIQRAYVTAMFDQHLQHRPSPLLNRPSARYPEVTLVP
jgi:pimeloyl-ACP methyl ester carboxylesterase